MINAKAKKSFLQHTATIFSYICLISAVICALILAFNFVDFSKVYRASFASSTFFFTTVGIVLREISRVSPPIEQSDQSNQSSKL
jgi:energy-converting hydrogenase Eha subunit A